MTTTGDRGTDEAGQQLALLTGPRRRPAAVASVPAEPLAATRPVARVLVDTPLPHLDRPFDYGVPERLDDDAQPGVRVRVRFSGRLLDGYLLERAEHTDHAGALARLQKVVSPEPVLGPDLARLTRAVADRYAGSAADVVRLAVPPRHARAEKAAVDRPPPDPPPPPDAGGWVDYDGGPAFLRGVATGGAPRAVWSALPGPGRWPDELARAAATAAAAGRGALLVVADLRDLARVDAALSALLGAGHHTVLSADLGPEARYRRWLAVRRGQVRVVLGTRAAMFAPVAAPGLFAVWDDGDDLHAEPRAPYPHVREVLAMRAGHDGAALLVGGHARTAEGAALVASGWARSLAAPRDTVRRTSPRVLAAGDDAELADDQGARGARLPTLAWRTAREALRSGPVLVQVPSTGYLPGLACADCRAAARCPACAGPLAGARAGPPACRWCGKAATGWTCPHCRSTRLRATRVGAGRTAEELGRAFPGTPVRTSSAGGVLAQVDDEPALVVATPGAEPVAPAGYAAALLLDGWALLSRPDLRVAEEALRRWLAAVALVRPAGAGGRVVLMADPAAPAVQALVRVDPVTFAERELADRQALRLPPAAALAALTGAPQVLERFLEAARLPDGVDVLGPVPVSAPRAGPPPADQPELERLLLRLPRARGRELAAALHAAAGVRSAHKEAGAVRVQLDPREIA